ncbi:MAG TPA: response regulator, partial [Azospirillaceae bacterium]|nr:response regulator [Azospirillaceae bacterium]
MPQTALAKLSYLVVDDEAFSRFMIARILRSVGAVRIIEAQDGRQALDKLADGGPVDCIIADISMPAMDGLALLETVRNGHANVAADVPYVVLSGHHELTLVAQAKKLQASTFVIKPVIHYKLVERLERIVAGEFIPCAPCAPAPVATTDHPAPVEAPTAAPAPVEATAEPEQVPEPLSLAKAQPVAPRRTGGPPPLEDIFAALDTPAAPPPSQVPSPVAASDDEFTSLTLSNEAAPANPTAGDEFAAIAFKADASGAPSPAKRDEGVFGTLLREIDDNPTPTPEAPPAQ